MRVIGKVPGLPEFVSQRTFGTPFESLETWLETGIGYCYVELRDALETHFDDGVAHSFVWQGDGSRPIVGIIFPSRDSVGRRFPLVVCDAIDIPSFSVQLAPVALGDYLEDIFAAAGEIAALTDRSAIAHAFENVRLPTPEDFASAKKEYGTWADETPLSAAWGRFVDGDAPEEAGPERAEGALATLRRAGLVRIPLGRGAAGAAAFWLQLIERSMHVPRAAFWAVDGSSILVSADPPTPACFAALFLPVDPPPSSVPAPRTSLLADVNSPVSRVMENLNKATST